MTQQDFAKALGISPASLSSIYNGRTAPTNKLVQSVHQRFPEISITWLMFGEGTMKSVATPSEEQQENTPQEISSVSLPNDSVSETATMTAAVDIEKMMENAVAKILDKPQRRITKIHVFYDDGTFEAFVSTPE